MNSGQQGGQGSQPKDHQVNQVLLKLVARL